MSGASIYARNQHQNRDELIVEYLPLVKKIGLHLAARMPADVDIDDLLQVGVIGLIQARESYDASQGASFSTYAGIRIKGAMLDEVRRNDWAPRSVLQKMKQVSLAIRTVENKTGRSALDGEIALELGIAIGEYQKIAAELVACKLTELEDQDGNDSIAQTVEAQDADPFREIEDDDFRQALVEAIIQLPEKEQLMMSLYYDEELNLKEIGEVLDVSESRVSQIHGQALARLRNVLMDWIG